MMLKKRIFALSIAFLLSSSIGVGVTQGGIAFASTSEKGTTNQDTKAAIEKAVKIVKQRISIPKQCTVFEYNINTDEFGETYYDLTWRDKDSLHYVQVGIDTKGNVLRYQYNDNSNQTKKLNYLKSELESTALKAAEQINPSTKGHLKLTSSRYTSRYSNAYEFVFTRVESDIRMNNTVSVNVSAEDKSITSYYANWLFDTKIPSSKANISKDAAKTQIKKNLTMNLEYKTGYSYKDGTYDKKVYLAYIPSIDYISVNANTGEVYLTNQVWNVVNTSTQEATAKDSAMNGSSNVLTEEEIKALNILDTLIDQKTAIQKVTENKYLLLDKKAVALTANLMLLEDKYYWTIELKDPREVDYSSDDYYRAYARAMVDAKTGEIISFYATTKDGSNTTKAPSLISKATAVKKFEAFVKTQNTSRLSNSKLLENSDDYVIAYDGKDRIYGGTSLRYSRVNEGVLYKDNGIYGSVDLVTGKVYQYSYQWEEDIQFESPKNAISSEKAIDSYLNLPGFDLVYEENIIHTYDKAYESKDEYYYNEDAYSIDREVRLVYSTSNIGSVMISPFTGKEIDYSGVEIASTQDRSSYTDIENSKYQRSILMLSDIGLGYQADKFLPTALITKNELIQFMEAANLYVNDDQKAILNDYRVTRQQAAEFVISCLGYSEVAKMNGIFTTGYADESTIAKNAVGAVAICKGYNILQFGENNTFGATEKLTREEAAKLVIDLLMLMNQKYYY